MATRTATQTAAEDDGGDSRNDRRSATFEFAGRDVELYEPSRGQRFILLQAVAVGDDGTPDREKLELVVGLAQMLRALFVNDGDRMFVTGALARDEADIEDYFELAKAMADHWDVEADAPTSRQERRARERRPAKAVPGRRAR